MEKFIKHKKDCKDINDCAVRLPSESDKILTFKNYKYGERQPFVVYADLESLLLKMRSDDTASQTKNAFQRHQAFSVGYYFHCSYDSSLCCYRSYRGENCMAWFAEELRDLTHRVNDILRNTVPMTALSSAERAAFFAATKCHVCRKPFEGDEPRVRDHCHFTGRFRGAAHANCNLMYGKSYAIPIVFHNLSGYDAHFIIKEIALKFEGKIDLLPITKEKYISFSKNVDETKTPEQKHPIKLRFIDSFKFLNTSLDKLVSFLGREKLNITKSQFKHLDDEAFDLLTRKGVFPYEYLDGEERLNETNLPPRESFYSSLNDSTVSESDYAHAVNVWLRFGIQNLGEYSDLYLKTDVLLLADVFENFRDNCLESYSLDPAHYFTLPGYTWDAMLKFTDVKLELLTDIDMVMFVERGIRGGLSQCSHRYARANNKYMQSYDSREPSTYLMYFDVNNLYGWAMSEPLPYADFQWIEDEEELRGIDVRSVPIDSPVGYILEVDLEYPEEIHDSHADLPFCPIRETPPNARQAKLLATTNDKTRYVIHYRNLQQCLAHGLRLKKVHRVLKFKQSPWLRGYIELNTRLRTAARNDFEKNLYKLMNNAVFGKTMENVRNHVDVKLFTKWEGRYGAESFIAKPNFHSRAIFDENLIAIEMRKLEVLFNKPIYVGMSILDISKTQVYEFHYDYMHPTYGEKCQVLYTDTDSLIYSVECDDMYESMKRNLNRFDTSDYPVNNVYNLPLVNKKVIGLMKDENCGAIMTEFVGLRSKMYALRVDGKKETKKIKGVKTSVVARTITFDDYVKCLNDRLAVNREQRFIRSKAHKVYTIRESKIALSFNDDKRFLIPGSSRTLPWGHRDIPKYNNNLTITNTTIPTTSTAMDTDSD